MGFCQHCKKWINQPEGRREKKFCNSTCRSNWWYGRNRKGKKVETPKPEIKYTVPTAASYDMPKPVIPVNDQPLSFDKLRQEIVPQMTGKPPKTFDQYMTWKRECENPDEWRELLKDLEANPLLNKKQKDIVKTANPSQL